MKKLIFFLFFSSFSTCISAQKYKIVLSTDIKTDDVYHKIQENICEKLYNKLNADKRFSTNLIYQPTKENFSSKLSFIKDFGADIVVVISCYHTTKYYAGTSCFIQGNGDYGDKLLKNYVPNLEISKKSTILSKNILYYLNKNGRIIQTDINEGKFALLSTENISILINVGIPNSYDDLCYIKSYLGQELLVNSIYKGISEYFNILQ